MNALKLHTADPLTDQFELLKCRIRSALNGKGGQPYALAFTSCVAGEGVTSVAANFAATMAESGDSHVLLMEGDLAQPSLHHVLKTRAPGRTKELTQDMKELAMPTWRIVRAYENLDVLLARQRYDNPSRLYANEGFREFLARAKERYDFVVIDCPPLQGPRGSAILPSRADGVILVVESGKVRREVVQRSVVVLEDMGANILGVVLNKREYPIPNMIYKRL